MSRILFVTIDAGGNVPPVVAIGHELARRGHDVHVLGHEHQRGVFEPLGFGFTGFRDLPHWNPAGAKSPIRTIRDYAGIASDPGVARQVTELLTRQPADLVVVDCMLLSALKAATDAAPATAVLMHTFYAFWDGRWRHGPVGALARLRGYSARRLWAGADLELVVADRDLDPASPAAGAHRAWSGAIETGVPRSTDAAGLPRVLVSLSTTWLPGQDDAYQRILTALGGLPVHAIVTTGPAVDPAALTAPANVELVAYAPHREILPTVSAVIGHGGHSTTMAALAHDLPLVIMPMHPLIDQPMVAAAVERAGAGITLRRTASPETIAAAVTTLLADPAYAEAAARIGARVRDARGATVAADRLLALLEPSAAGRVGSRPQG